MLLLHYQALRIISLHFYIFKRRIKKNITVGTIINTSPHWATDCKVSSLAIVLSEKINTPSVIYTHYNNE